MPTLPATTFSQPALFRFHYAPRGREAGATVVFPFDHPAPRDAIGAIQSIEQLPTSSPIPPEQGVEILFIPTSHRDDASAKELTHIWLAAAHSSAETVTVRSGELQVLWKPARAVIIAPALQALPAIESLVDFSHYEAVLRQIETAIAAGWAAAEAAAPLAYAITRLDSENDREVGRRMQAVLQSRMQLSRIEPHVLRPAQHLPPAARVLGESLREATLCEERLETADGQIETQEYVYELASQRLGEHRHARKGFMLETIIIILLAAEVLLMIGEIFW